MHAFPVWGRKGRSTLQPVPFSSLGGGESPSSSSSAASGWGSSGQAFPSCCTQRALQSSHAVFLVSADLPFVSNHQAGFLISWRYCCGLLSTSDVFWHCSCSDADVDLGSEPTDLNYELSLRRESGLVSFSRIVSWQVIGRIAFSPTQAVSLPFRNILIKSFLTQWWGGLDVYVHLAGLTGLIASWLTGTGVCTRLF